MMKISDFLGLGQPPELLGMMSGEEWNRRMLALPAPSYERDEERAAHRNAGYQRALEINCKAQAELDKRIENYRRFGVAEPKWTITVHNVKSKKTRLYFVSSTRRLQDGRIALLQSVDVANSKAAAKRSHREGHQRNSLLEGSRETQISAFSPGVWS